jgi:hypothetical protein
MRGGLDHGAGANFYRPSNWVAPGRTVLEQTQFAATSRPLSPISGLPAGVRNGKNLNGVGA